MTSRLAAALLVLAALSLPAAAPGAPPGPPVPASIVLPTKIVGGDSTIGTVASSRDESSVVAPHGGTVVEWLVEDGDLVSPGQPLIRLHPEGGS